MGSKERRQKEREEVRVRILDAARELFVGQGYEAVTMRKIAEKIDYTATALYVHFKDKESLLRELCSTDFRALRGAFGRLAQIADPVERLRALGMAYVEYGLANPNHYRLLFMTPRPADVVPDDSIEKGNPDEDAYAFLRETLADGIEAGLFRPEYTDADLLAQVFWSTVHGLVALRLTKGNDAWIEWRPVMDAAQVLVETTIRGVLRGEG